ncbi:MAG: lipoate--protein ligase family protein [bacterium]|nr:lipoate--protein ligase family protein [bacterium]
MTQSWRLLVDGPGSASWNMAVDEALLLCAPESGPSLRLYTWSLPALSLGYRQSPPDWLGRCDELGVATVRRVSGGGSVLHAGDLTYAVVAPSGLPGLPEDLRGSYEWIRGVLVDGLRRAGLSAQPSRAEPDAERLDLCFAGATGFEIELEGKKLIGSAQRRIGSGFLQHGAIRLSDDSELYESITGTTRAGQAPVSCADVSHVSASLIAAFRERVGGNLAEMPLTARETAVARERVEFRAQKNLCAPPLILRTFLRSADSLP